MQRPRLWKRPAGRLDLGDAQDAVELGSAYGLTADEWQAWVIEGWLARSRSTGKLASSQCGLTVPRQNGKNAILEIVELFKMVVQGRKVLHTAHEVKTARKAFLRLCSFFENERQFPELAALVVGQPRKTNGQEAIYLSNGGSVEFIARSKGSGRGFTVDDLVCDEAQELSDEALAALMPTISAAPSRDPQILFTGTPPSELMNGEVFTRVRKNALDGKDHRRCWDEWSCPEKVDVDDIRSAATANPALGLRLSRDVISDERAAMDEETFMRERLGMWIDANTFGGFFTVGSWSDGADAGSSIVKDQTFGLAVSWDRAHASIAAAGWNDAGRLHLELVRHERGAVWAVDALKELQSRHGGVVAVDGRGPAAPLIPQLELAGVRLVVLSTGDVLDACAAVFDRVREGGHAHLGDPTLDAAVKSARQRPVGDRFAIGRRNPDSPDVSPFEAATLAAWAVEHTENYDVLDSVR